MQQLLDESPFLEDECECIHIRADSIEIVARTSFTLPTFIERKRSLLKWEFESKGYEILFSIAKVNSNDANGQLSYLSPLSSYAPDILHSGQFLIEDPGKYVLVWDNTNSWFRERIVNYQVDMTRGLTSKEEKLVYAQRINKVNEDHLQELSEVNNMISLQQKEKELIKDEQDKLLNQLQSLQTGLCHVDEVIAIAEEDIRMKQQETAKHSYALEQLLRQNIFILEGERLFSMSHGVDLLRLACVSHLLHDAVYQDGIWKTVFYQEYLEDLAPVLQNEALRYQYQLVRPQPMSRVTDQQKQQIQVKEEVVKSSDEVIVSLKELSMLYKITERQGWYVNKEGICYFIRFMDASKKEYTIIFGPTNTADLDALIRQTLKSTVLIPMPGTDAGHSGYYIDRFRRVSKWNVERVEGTDGKELKWQEVKM